MDILVISDEPALAETLAGELPEFTLAPVPLSQAKDRLAHETFKLLVADKHAAADLDLPSPGDSILIQLTRPVRLCDLLYTIRARLQGKSGPVRSDIALAPGYVLSLGERLIRSDGSAADIPLTEKEMELLVCLLEHNDENMTREQLLKRVWGYGGNIDTHTLETHIYRLRGKLRQASASFDIAFSEENGYRLTLGAS